MAFGPDGNLYIGMGDGGGSVANNDRSQNPNTLLGKMLRVDVNVLDSNPNGYVVPGNNPFVGNKLPLPALDEIWAFGLDKSVAFYVRPAVAGGDGRAPHRRRGPGSMGGNHYQFLPGAGGRNYGWSGLEGTQPFHAHHPPVYQPRTNPIIQYLHGDGALGDRRLRYRGRLLGGNFFGRYFYADFVKGRVWSAALSQPSGQASNILYYTAALGGTATLGSHQLVRDRLAWRALYRRLFRRHGLQGLQPAPLALRSMLRRAGRPALSPSISAVGRSISGGTRRGHRSRCYPRAGFPAGRRPRHPDRPYLRPCAARRRRDFRPPVHELGYGLMVTGLQPGPYQLVVSMHSTVTNTFNRSKTVNVNVTGPSPNPSFGLTGR